MPSLYQFPPLERWDEFEMLCRDLWSVKYSVAFKLYGTRGSTQHGVDSYASIDGSIHAIQCKGKRIYPERELNLSDIRETVDKAKRFPQRIKVLHIATTAQRKAEIQNRVIDINQELKQDSLFEIELHFWNEIQEMLSEYPQVADKYYQSRRNPKKSVFALLISVIIASCCVLAWNWTGPVKGDPAKSHISGNDCTSDGPEVTALVTSGWGRKLVYGTPALIRDDKFSNTSIAGRVDEMAASERQYRIRYYGRRDIRQCTAADVIAHIEAFQTWDWSAKLVIAMLFAGSMLGLFYSARTWLSSFRFSPK